MLADHFSAMRGMGLRNLPPPDRRAGYDALRMTARADEIDDSRITGTFGADLTVCSRYLGHWRRPAPRGTIRA